MNKLKGIVGLFLGNKKTKASSHYKRLNRIFRLYAFSSLWLYLLKYVFGLLCLKSDYLILDGTGWNKGVIRHHYLTLSVVYKGVSIPIYILDLRKRGISSQKERKKIIRKAKKHFNLSGKILLADREYNGVDWFNFLTENKIDFVIRLKKGNYKVAINQADGHTYDRLTQKVSKSKIKNKSVAKRVVIGRYIYTFVAMKNPNAKAKDKIIYLLSSLNIPAIAIAAKYPIRWQIEMCFKHLKSNGFDLEKMNVKGIPRQNLMLAIVIFAYTISICFGLKDYHKVPMKTFENNRVQKAISLFRWGTDNLVQILHDLKDFCAFISQFIQPKNSKYKSSKSIFI